jgi:uncharacterized protein
LKLSDLDFNYPGGKMIIDSHVHYGGSDLFDSIIDEKTLMESMKKNNIDACIVQPLPEHTIEDARSAHNEIYRLSQKYHGKIYGLACINPNLSKKEVIQELERCINEYSFVGIKCHTICHAVSPLSDRGDLLFRTADRLGVPVVVHTGKGIPFSCPSLNIVKARQYPGLKIILAHAGMHLLMEDAYTAAKECKNIFLETSWTPAEDIEWLIRKLGSEKIMMGSDIYNASCYNQAVELEKYRVLDLKPKEKENCLFKTANSVFDLNL